MINIFGYLYVAYGVAQVIIQEQRVFDPEFKMYDDLWIEMTPELFKIFAIIFSLFWPVIMAVEVGEVIVDKFYDDEKH